MKKQENENKSIKVLKTVVSDGHGTTTEIQLSKKKYDEMKKLEFSNRIHKILEKYGLRNCDFEEGDFEKGQISRWFQGKVLPDSSSIERICTFINNYLSEKKRISDEINISYLDGKSEYMTKTEADVAAAERESAAGFFSEIADREMLLCKYMILDLKSNCNYSGGYIYLDNGTTISINDVMEKYQKEMAWYSKCVINRIIEEYSPKQDENRFTIDPETLQPIKL